MFLGWGTLGRCQFQPHCSSPTVCWGMLHPVLALAPRAGVSAGRLQEACRIHREGRPQSTAPRVLPKPLSPSRPWGDLGMHSRWVSHRSPKFIPTLQSRPGAELGAACPSACPCACHCCSSPLLFMLQKYLLFGFICFSTKSLPCKAFPGSWGVGGEQNPSTPSPALWVVPTMPPSLRLHIPTRGDAAVGRHQGVKPSWDTLFPVCGWDRDKG